MIYLWQGIVARAFQCIRIYGLFDYQHDVLVS